MSKIFRVSSISVVFAVFIFGFAGSALAQTYVCKPVLQVVWLGPKSYNVTVTTPYIKEYRRKARRFWEGRAFQKYKNVYRWSNARDQGIYCTGHITEKRHKCRVYARPCRVAVRKIGKRCKKNFRIYKRKVLKNVVLSGKTDAVQSAMWAKWNKSVKRSFGRGWKGRKNPTFKCSALPGYSPFYQCQVRARPCNSIFK